MSTSTSSQNNSSFHSISSFCQDNSKLLNFEEEHFRHPLTSNSYFFPGMKKSNFNISSSKNYEEVSTTTLSAANALDESTTSSPSIQDSEENKSSGNNIECVVCGDKSSGKHYGQYTCEGCKSFFKRSVRRNLTYSCRGNHNCPIDIHHRNQCQNCRFQKCIKMGMRKEAVQQGRIPQYSSYCNQFINPNFNNPYLYKYFGLFPQNTDLQKDPKMFNNNPAFNSSFHCSFGQHDDQNLSQKYCGIDGIYDVASKILQGVIEWSTSIPFFPGLAIMDQITLLKASWAELFILTASHFSIPLHLAPLLASVGLQSNPGSAEKVYILLDHLRLIQEQIDRLKRIQIDPAEFSCLKALVLFNSDIRGLTDTAHIDHIQETVQSALEEYERFHNPNQSTRFGKLLLRIPQLKSINASIIEELLFGKYPGKSSIDNIIKDYVISTYASHSASQILVKDPSKLSILSNINSLLNISHSNAISNKHSIPPNNFLPNSQQNCSKSTESK